eukprot:4706860-Prymnesium_polylepis.1
MCIRDRSSFGGWDWCSPPVLPRCRSPSNAHLTLWRTPRRTVCVVCCFERGTIQCSVGCGGCVLRSLLYLLAFGAYDTRAG